ncbi:MAG: ABC transporter [Arcobacter sp.]|mgnify:CR=1 FL=1|nr:MAG: ABC transporter [Arcobacter sp.]
MKNLIIFALTIITFNACSVTSYYKVNSNLEFEAVAKEDRNTYILFGKERALELKENKDKKFFVDEGFTEEFAEKPDDFDPLEPYNRVMTSFNDYVYVNLLTPTAEAYSKVMPKEARIGISNFFHNITFPIRFVNNILQFKFSYALEELGRFSVNSTAGVLGFMDPAKEYLNLEKREEDFGQTLGYYGVGEGFHIVMPLLGPSNLRDRIGSFADGYIAPFSYYSAFSDKITDDFFVTIGVSTFESINSTSLNLGQYESIKKDAIDLYPFLKDSYTQIRKKAIKE